MSDERFSDYDRSEPGGQDPFEARIRRALSEEAAMVSIRGDGLTKIREAVADSGRRGFWTLPRLVAGLAAATVVLGAGAMGVEQLRGGDDHPVIATPTSPSPSPAPSGSGEPTSTTSPSPAPSKTFPAPGPTGTGSATGTVAVPVYYLAESGSRAQLRLYREFHRVAATGPRGRLAVEEMLRGTPADPDYVSLWPTSTRVRSYTTRAGVATVDLSRAALTANAGSDGAAKSLQQLVYTVTAADRSVSAVRLRIGGMSVSELWGAVQVGDRPIRRAPAMDVQGWIWILAPTQESTTRSPVTVDVLGNTFEGNVILRVYRDGSKVAETFVTTSMGSWAEAKTTIALPPGNYTLRAFEDSGEPTQASPESDSKDFTVR